MQTRSPYKVSDFGLDGNRNHGLTRIRSVDTERNVFGSANDAIIHPGVTHDVTGIDLQIPVDHQRLVATHSDLDAVVEIGAENTPVQEIKLHVSARDIADAVLPDGYGQPQ